MKKFMMCADSSNLFLPYLMNHLFSILFDTTTLNGQMLVDAIMNEFEQL